MGAWGTGVFENDEALDWAIDLAEVDDLKAIEQTLDWVLDGKESYIEVDTGEMGLAAAETVAALLGRPATDLPGEIVEWVDRHASLDAARLREPCLRAIERVLTPETSEVHDLWSDAEPDMFDEWKSGVANLVERLSAM